MLGDLGGHAASFSWDLKARAAEGCLQGGPSGDSSDMRGLDPLLGHLPSREPFLLPKNRRWGLRVTQPVTPTSTCC